MQTETLTGYRVQMRIAEPYAHQEVTVGGVHYLEVPVVMIREGVHNGSRGAIFHKKETLEAHMDSFNGIPVTISHPRSGGQFVSANTSGVVHVGRVQDVQMVGGKLTAKLRLNSNLLLAQSPETHQAVLHNQPVEVSVGVYSTEDRQPGEWNGEQFESTALDYYADHLALLPGETGACSWNDGCGIRANSAGINDIVGDLPGINNSTAGVYGTPQRYGGTPLGTIFIPPTYPTTGTLPLIYWDFRFITNKKDTMEDIKLTIEQLLAAGAVDIQVNKEETGWVERINLLGRAVDALDSRAYFHSIEEVYPDYLVYRRWGRAQEGSTVPPEPTRYFKTPYTFTGNTPVLGDPEEVQKTVKYTNINTNQNNEDMKEKVCPSVVEALIANTNSQFTPEDREWLLTLNAEQIAKLQPVTPEKVEVEKPLTDEAVSAYLSSKDDPIALLPEGIQANVRSGLELRETSRKETIQEIMNNANQVWTEQELNAMSCSDLNKLKTALGIQMGNYSARGSSRATAPAGSDDEKLLPPGVE